MEEKEMRIITEEEFNEMLDKHECWLRKEEGGEKLRLTNCILKKYLKEIKGRNLRYAEFYNCNIDSLKFLDCILQNTYFELCKIKYLFFKWCDISRSSFAKCKLLNNIFYDDNLRLCIFKESNLKECSFKDSNLSGVEIKKCELKNIITNNTTSFYNLQCPEEGSFIGFKKAYIEEKNGYGSEIPVIVKLEITEDSLRSSANSRKCRCSKAKVLSISYLDGRECNDKIAHSAYDNNFTYKVGETLEIDNFDKDRWNECSIGIHFFITRDEAVNYR